MAKVLSFNLEKEKQTALRILCFRIGCQYIIIDPERQNETLAELCETTGAAKTIQSRHDCFTEEMLVFCGLSKQELNDFLDFMRSNNLNVIHKAVITEFNKNWSAAKLFHEIDAEYRKIERMKKQKKRKK